MITSEFKHLKKDQLKKRVKILTVLVYLAIVIGVSGFVVFLKTDYKYHWSWLLIAFTYISLSVSWIGQVRRMRKEIAIREELQSNSTNNAIL